MVMNLYSSFYVERQRSYGQGVVITNTDSLLEVLLITCKEDVTHLD